MERGHRLAETFARYAASRRKQRAWSLNRPGNRAIRDEVSGTILEFAGEALRAGEVLDMGCGTGWWLERVLAIDGDASRLHGVDLLEGRVEASRRRVPGACVQVADVRRLPYEDDRFRAVSLLLVLSSLADRPSMRATLREARRVVAPGGVVVVWEPRWPNPFNRVTHTVPALLVDQELGAPSKGAKVTVLPQLARALRTRRSYDRFAAIGALRTHRVTMHRPKP